MDGRGGDPGDGTSRRRYYWEENGEDRRRACPCTERRTSHTITDTFVVSSVVVFLTLRLFDKIPPQIWTREMDEGGDYCGMKGERGSVSVELVWLDALFTSCWEERGGELKARDCWVCGLRLNAMDLLTHTHSRLFLFFFSGAIVLVLPPSELNDGAYYAAVSAM